MLVHLKDIRFTVLPPDLFPGKKGFDLHFDFSPNKWFYDMSLSKRYILEDDGEGTLDHSVGHEIDWKPGMDITLRTIKKKHKRRSWKGARRPTIEEKNPSFFNFFSPPDMPENTEVLCSALALHIGCQSASAAATPDSRVCRVCAHLHHTRMFVCTHVTGARALTLSRVTHPRTRAALGNPMR